jgi:large subunit ribosomal protein L22
MSKALLKFVRVSPTKARLVARQVQGMNAEIALAALEFMPNKAAGIIAKVIASAVANGEYEPEEVIIASCRVDKAAVMKRWRPRARGTASRIIKPTAHIMVEVTTASDAEAAKAKPSDTKSKAKTPKIKKAADTGAKKKSSVKPDTANKPDTAKTASRAVKTKSESNAPKKSSAGDDLTKIKGIGKVYAGKLNDEGIFTYTDVADMSDEQIQMMEEKYTFRGDFRESVADAKNFVNGKEA